MPVPVGSTAPNFSLRSLGPEGLHDVRLSDHLGKPVVLLFFPGAFTPVCTKEFCDVSQGMGPFAGLDATVFGISNDTPWALDAWAKQFKITVPLLADFQHEVVRAYDVVWPNFSGLGPATARAVILIDKDGIVRYTEQTPSLGDQPNFTALEAALKEL